MPSSDAMPIDRSSQREHSAPAASLIGMRRPVLLGILACLVLFVTEACVWSWKTSGILQISGSWRQYPWDYTAITHLPGLGEWPLMKENFIYIQHHQAFLGVRDQYVRPTSGFEHMRTLYGYLTQGLWFLGPVFSGLVLNVVFWGLACLCAVYVAVRLFPQQRWAPWVAALLVLSGQGFLSSVGEVSPHVLGYSMGFWVAAYVCAKRLWRADSRAVDHFLVHGFVGILKLGYESAWFSWPFLILIGWYASTQRTHRLFPRRTAFFLAGCSLLSLGPGALMILISRPFGAADSVTTAMLLLRNRPMVEILMLYFAALTESILAFGPFVLALLAAGIVATIRARDRFGLALAGTTMAVLAATAVIVMPYFARGYTTFHLALPLFIIAIRGYSWIWERRSSVRYAAPALLAGCIVWSNAPMFGFALPLPGFELGFIHTLQEGHWQDYQMIQFR